MSLVTVPPGEPSIQYLARYNSGPYNLPVTRVVIHDEEYPVKDGSAVTIAQLFVNDQSGNAHYAVDPDDEQHCVPDNTIAWHAPPNKGSVGIEQNGYATFSTQDWENPDSLKTLRRCAARTAELCNRFGLPLVWLQVPDLLAGKYGITSHANVSAAWHQSDHTDPGVNFPVDLFLQYVREASGLGPGSTGGSSEMFEATCTKTGEVRLVDTAGEVFTFHNSGQPGGLYLGGLNVHPFWNAGEGHAAGPVIGAWNWPGGAKLGPDGVTRDGLVILTRDTSGNFHSYAFPGDGSLAKPGPFG